MSVFNTNNKKSHLNKTIFFDESISLARYETLKYPHLDKMTDKQLSFFWRPEEVDITKDKADFASLNDHEKHIFTSNLKRQILLDSVQGRAPVEALLPIASIPELEPLIVTWSFMETIHSRSYTHIIRNIYSNPSKIFDEMLDIEDIVSCGDKVSKYYDDLIDSVKLYELFGVGTHEINGEKITVSLYDLKKKLWLCLNSINILEGVRFYTSFACSWAFAELKKMEGNAKIIKFIARDENVHLAISQSILKLLPKDDKDFLKISKTCEKEVINMFTDAIEQEKKWAQYLFKDGSMIGLNKNLLNNYIEWIGSKRMRVLGIQSPYNTPQANPLPWTEKWIGGANVQVAPQETQISSYTIGDIKQDLTKDILKGFNL